MSSFKSCEGRREKSERRGEKGEGRGRRDSSRPSPLAPHPSPLAGLDHLGHAVQILVGRNAMLNQRLYEAAREFSLALERPEGWPRDLLKKARSVEKRLTTDGPIATTINGMDVSVAREIAQEMYTLAMAVNTLQIDAGQIARRRRDHVKLPPRKAGKRRRLDIEQLSH